MTAFWDHARLIIVECLDRYIGESIPIPPRRSGRMEWLPYRDDLRTICRTAYSRLTISPLKVMLQRVCKSFQDDRVFPNVHKEKVAVRHLRDGQPMLFLRAIEKPRRFDGIPRSVDVYAKLRDDLLRRRI